jgi:hypothetical protein
VDRFTKFKVIHNGSLHHGRLNVLDNYKFQDEQKAGEKIPRESAKNPHRQSQEQRHGSLPHEGGYNRSIRGNLPISRLQALDVWHVCGDEFEREVLREANVDYGVSHLAVSMVAANPDVGRMALRRRYMA